MDLGMQLILGIIFGIIGFLTDKIWGIPYKIFSDIGAAIFIVSLMFFVSPVVVNPSPNVAAKSIEKLVKFFVESLPSIVVGDIVGTAVSEKY